MRFKENPLPDSWILRCIALENRYRFSRAISSSGNEISYKIILFIFQIIVIKIRIHNKTRSRTLYKLIYWGIFYPAFFPCACERSFETASFCLKFWLFSDLFKSLTTKIDFVDFLQIQAAFWKTNYTTSSYLVRPIYGQDMSENYFLTVAAKFRFCSIFPDICS